MLLDSDPWDEYVLCVFCITVALINGPLKGISGGGFLSESQRKLLEQSCSLFRPSRLPVLESNRLVDTVSKIMDDCDCVEHCSWSKWKNEGVLYRGANAKKCFSHQGPPYKQHLILWSLGVDVIF